MTSTEIARARYDTMAQLTRGKITPDECRAANAALRAKVGDEAFEAAAGAAVANHVRAFG